MTLAPPVSTLVLTATAVGFTLLSNILILKFVDVKAERRAKAEVTQFNKDLRAAKLAKDKKTEERLLKRQTSIRQAQLKMQTGRLKVTFATFVPFILLYYLILGFVGPAAAAYSPFQIPVLTSSCTASTATATTTTTSTTATSTTSTTSVSTTTTVSTTTNTTATGPPPNPCPTNFPTKLLSQGTNWYVTTFGWYLISSFTFSTLITKLLKTQP